MNMSFYIIYTTPLVNNDILNIIGLYVDENSACKVVDELTHKKVDLGVVFRIKRFVLNQPQMYQNHLQQISITEPPEYLLTTIAEESKKIESKEAVSIVLEKSFHKILDGVIERLDDPEIVVEYVEGLKNNVEDYL